MRRFLWVVGELAVALTLMVGSQPSRPSVDHNGLEQTIPAKTKPKYHTTDKTKFWVDGVEVTEKEFLKHDRLVIDELVIDGEEVQVIKAHTKK